MSVSLPYSEYQKRLWALHRAYAGDFIPPSREVGTANCHEKLTREQVLEASVMLSRFLGVSVSGDGFDLNKLLQVYLRDLDGRGVLHAAAEGPFYDLLRTRH